MAAVHWLCKTDSSTQGGHKLRETNMRFAKSVVDFTTRSNPTKHPEKVLKNSRNKFKNDTTQE